MPTVAINLTLIGFIVFPIVALIFGFAVYFFIKSRKNLKETLEASKIIASPFLKKEKVTSYKRSSLVELEEQFARQRFEASKSEQATVSSSKKLPVQEDENLVQNLKQTIAQQQNMLNKYLDTIREVENEGREELRKKNEELQDEIIHLSEVIEKKNDEIKDLVQQAGAAQKMAAKIEEVYQEFDQLQTKMQVLERQAGRANILALELEDTRNAYEVIHKELSRKQEKLEEVMLENRSMQEEINMLEDKLSESNLQRQQLQKKVQFLTELNNDMQDISETNKKLQTEMRRIGELESMLNMMAEERDYLLRKKLEK